jgi:uncharacterized cupredoxin-like copper-binding protein
VKLKTLAVGALLTLAGCAQPSVTTAPNNPVALYQQASSHEAQRARQEAASASIPARPTPPASVAAAQPPMDHGSMPVTQPVVKPGESFTYEFTASPSGTFMYLIRMLALGQMAHPMHMHGHAFDIVATDGYPVQGPPLTKDVLQIAPGERYDLVMTADNPGAWLFHCTS